MIVYLSFFCPALSLSTIDHVVFCLIALPFSTPINVIEKVFPSKVTSNYATYQRQGNNLSLYDVRSVTVLCAFQWLRPHLDNCIAVFVIQLLLAALQAKEIPHEKLMGLIF